MFKGQIYVHVQASVRVTSMRDLLAVVAETAEVSSTATVAIVLAIISLVVVAPAMLLCGGCFEDSKPPPPPVPPPPGPHQRPGAHHYPQGSHPWPGNYPVPPPGALVNQYPPPYGYPPHHYPPGMGPGQAPGPQVRQPYPGPHVPGPPAPPPPGGLHQHPPEPLITHGVPGVPPARVSTSSQPSGAVSLPELRCPTLCSSAPCSSPRLLQHAHRHCACAAHVSQRTAGADTAVLKPRDASLEAVEEVLHNMCAVMKGSVRPGKTLIKSTIRCGEL